MSAKLPKDVRKFIRLEKNRIRKTVGNLKEQQGLIEELKKKFVLWQK